MKHHSLEVGGLTCCGLVGGALHCERGSRAGEPCGVCRDDKPSDEGTPWGEQEELEQSMLRRTGARAAAAGAAAGVGGAQEQFDLVFEDQIDFVNLDAIAGDDLSSRYADSISFSPCIYRSPVPAVLPASTTLHFQHTHVTARLCMGGLCSRC